MTIPDPFDIDLFCGLLAEQRGRPLRVLPLKAPTGTHGPCGAWAATDTRDYLFYDRASTQWHRDVVVLHETGHRIAGHGELYVGQDPSAVNRPPRDSHINAAAVKAIGEWLPDISGETVRHVFGRASYSTPREHEAEMLATMILERGSRTPTGPLSCPNPPPGVAQNLQRISATLGARPLGSR